MRKTRNTSKLPAIVPDYSAPVNYWHRRAVEKQLPAAKLIRLQEKRIADLCKLLTDLDLRLTETNKRLKFVESAVKLTTGPAR